MKDKPAFSILSTLVALLIPATVHANLNGSDNFNDNSKDLTKWDTDAGFGTPAGVLTEISGHVEYTATSAPNIYQSRSWKLNVGSYTQNWDVQLDTTILGTAVNSEYVQFGIEAYITGQFSGQYAGVAQGMDSSGKQFYSNIGEGNGTVLDSNFAATLSASGAVRLGYNASTQVITTYYDPDGSTGGYTWTPLRTYGISAGANGAVNQNWGMTAANTFSIDIYGYSDSRAVASGQAFGDNFIATPEPSSMALLMSAGAFLVGSRRRQPRRVPTA